LVIRHDIDPKAYLADEKKYPSVFQLLPGEGVATLIHPQWAVTAAHCIYLLLEKDFRNQPFKVTIADLENIITEVRYPSECSDFDEVMYLYQEARKMQQDLTSEEFVVEIFAKLTSLAGPNDIALLKLKYPVTHTKPLQFYQQKDEVGQKAMMVGWGDFSTGDKGILTTSDHNYNDGCFRYTENYISQIRNGMLAFDFDKPNTPNVLPLEGVNGPGDSGSPMFLSTPEGVKIAGVSSYSSCLTKELDKEVERKERAMQLYDTIEHYTRISDHINWLYNIIGLQEV